MADRWHPSFWIWIVIVRTWKMTVSPAIERRSVSIVVVSLLFIAATNLLVGDFIQDDGYITFHYAQNLTDYGSLYYNRGEQGPFGYTNPLYIFILASLRLLSLKLLSFETISRLVASLSLFTIVVIVLKVIVTTVGEKYRRRAGGLIVLSLWVLLAFPFLLPNFYSGLETALFTLTLFVLILALVLPDSVNERCVWIALAVALTIRFDSLFLLLPLLGLYAVRAIRSADQKQRRYLIYVLIFVALVFLVQLVISRSWIPLSFGHKKQDFSAATWWAYIRFMVITLSPLIVALFNRPIRRRLLLMIVYGLYVSLFYSFFFHWHFERYLFPYLFALFATLWVVFLQSWDDDHWRLAAIFLVYTLVAFLPGTIQGYSWVSGYRVAMLNPKRIADAFVNAQLEERYRLYACYDVGYIAYKTGWRVIDLSGLTTPEVTRQDVGEVIAGRNPTVLIISTGGVEPGDVKLYSQYQSTAADLPANYRFVKRLPLINKYWWSGGQYGYTIFVNQNANERLVAGLQEISVDVDGEIGYQKYVIYFLQWLAALTTW